MKIEKIWFEGGRLYGLTNEGQTLWQSLLYYPRLRYATDKQRASYKINAFGIRWEALDEDVSFDSFFYDEPEPHGISKVLLSHPELNMSAVARRLGVQQSLLAAYANGTKKPSKKREEHILNELRLIGKELQDVSI
ncbi:MAG: DUF2442 domain-containing protein [Prevotella sp.]|nr:DUF2442 domain-containing protein [Prevotella sp.]